MMSTRGSVASHLPSTTFCWLPPLRVPATVSRALVFTSRRLAQIWAAAFSMPAVRRPAFASWRRMAIVDVARDRRVEDEALLAAVLGDEGEAEPHRRGRVVLRDGDPADADAAGVVGVDAEDRSGDLAAAGADEAGEADDLARAHREADVVEDSG